MQVDVDMHVRERPTSLKPIHSYVHVRSTLQTKQYMRFYHTIVKRLHGVVQGDMHGCAQGFTGG